MKGLEDAGTLHVGHPHAVIDDADEGSISFGDCVQFQAGRPNRVREAVVDQVVQDAADLPGVGVDWYGIEPEGGVDPRPTDLHPGLCSCDRLLHGLAKIEVRAG